MKYVLCVDTQPQLNPSEDIRKYIIEIEELRKKDDVYDTLVINNEGQIIVTRRIGILDGKTYKLDEEVIEELYNIDIELFNGINYVYLENITGLSMTLDYVLKNDTEDSYPTMIQMNSAITQTASEIQLNVNKKLVGYATVENLTTVKNTADSAAVMARGAQNTANGAAQRAVNVQSDLRDNYSTTVEMNSAISISAANIMSVVSTKVGENEIISKINQTSEQISIEASKIALEGYTTINNGFSIDNNGNASIANGSVIIDNTGIKMADNTQIIGGQGLMTNLQLIGELSSQNANNMFNQFWWYDYGTFRFLSDYIIIPVDIPSNFTVTNANIKLIEHPVYWSNHSRYGYVKELGLYQIDSSSKLTANFQSSTDIYDGMITRISNCWGTNRTTTWTPTTPTDNNYGAQTVKSIDLKNFLDNDNNITFAIKSDHTETYNESTSTRIEAENTCYVTAVLNVYGFMAF